MGHQYGRSRAAVLIEAGEFEAALQAASEEIARERDNSEHWWDRASALASLERYDEAVADFEHAKEADAKSAVLDDAGGGGRERGLRDAGALRDDVSVGAARAGRERLAEAAARRAQEHVRQRALRVASGPGSNVNG